jgi:hypothetical protein
MAAQFWRLNYRTTALARFENTNILFFFEKRSSLVDVNSKVVGLIFLRQIKVLLKRRNINT